MTKQKLYFWSNFDNENKKKLLIKKPQAQNFFPFQNFGVFFSGVNGSKTPGSTWNPSKNRIKSQNKRWGMFWQVE